MRGSRRTPPRSHSGTARPCRSDRHRRSRSPARISTDVGTIVQRACGEGRGRSRTDDHRAHTLAGTSARCVAAGQALDTAIPRPKRCARSFAPSRRAGRAVPSLRTRVAARTGRRRTRPRGDRHHGQRRAGRRREAHGGHFALVTGRTQPDGAIGDWLVNNFYSLDVESEKGILPRRCRSTTISPISTADRAGTGPRTCWSPCSPTIVPPTCCRAH